MNAERWDQLCDRHLAGGLAADEAEEFARACAGEPARARDLLRRAQDEELLRRVFLDRAPDAVRGRRIAFAAAIAACLVAAIGLGLWFSASAGDRLAIARLEDAAAVQVVRGGTTTPGTGGGLRAGDGLVVGGDGTAVIAFPDGSRLRAVAGTRLALIGGQAGDGSGGGKRLFLEDGGIQAEVVPQPASEPLTIASPHAVATVVGTRFTLAVDHRSTRLAVEHGVVRLAAGGGGEALIGAGRSGEATAAGLLAEEARIGIAARHLGDRGLDADPAVLFHDDFESGGFDRWDDRDGNRPPAHRIVGATEAHAGRHAALLRQPADDVPSDLVKWLGGGHELVHVRWYQAVDDLSVAPRPVLWGGLAAVRDRSLLGSTAAPDGSNYFSARIDAWGSPTLSSFRPGLRAGPDGRFDQSPVISRTSSGVSIAPGPWRCLELMLRANRPGSADGEQAFWVDGVEQARERGLRLRDADRLGINALWLSFLARGATAPCGVRIDDVVVATGYIGPRAPE